MPEELREERAVDARIKGRDREREQLGAGEVDAHRLSGDLAVAHRHQGAAGVRRDQVRGREREHPEQHHVRPVERKQRRPLHREAHPAARERRNVGQKLVRGDAEAERRDREVRARQPQRGKSNHDARERGNEARPQQREQPRQALQMREGVRADGEEAGLAKRNLTGVPDEQVLSHHADGGDGDERAAHDPRRLPEKRQRDGKGHRGRQQRPSHPARGETKLLAPGFDQIHQRSP